MCTGVYEERGGVTEFSVVSLCFLFLRRAEGAGVAESTRLPAHARPFPAAQPLHLPPQQHPQ